MKLDALLSTIILVTFLITVIMAVGSYIAYKLRESRRPRMAPTSNANTDTFFERISADDLCEPE